MTDIVLAFCVAKETIGKYCRLQLLHPIAPRKGTLFSKEFSATGIIIQMLALSKSTSKQMTPAPSVSFTKSHIFLFDVRMGGGGGSGGGANLSYRAGAEDQ